jgi:hypothetical protein
MKDTVVESGLCLRKERQGSNLGLHIQGLDRRTPVDFIVESEVWRPNFVHQRPTHLVIAHSFKYQS